MKWILPALALCASVGCAVPNDSPIRILGARPLKPSDTDCAAFEEMILAGSLDIGAQPAYFVQLDMQSDLQQIDTSTGGQKLADGSRNNFYGNEMLVTYSSTPALTFEQESVPIHFVIEPGADAFVRLNLLSRKALDVLTAGVGTDTIDLRVQLEFRGALASGQKLRSNTIVYPIEIRDSGFAGCAMGTLLKRNGPCGNWGGQDGIPVVCCPVDPADPTKCK